MAVPTASDNPFPSLLLVEGSAPASPSSGQRRLYALSSDHLPYVKDSAGTIYRVGTFVTCRKTGDESFSTTGYNDSTNMGLAIAASRNYLFQYVIYYTTNATSVGIKIALNGPTNCTCYAFTRGSIAAGSVSAAATLVENVQASGNIATDLEVLTPATGPGTSANGIVIYGTINNSTNAGTLKLRHGSETATATTILQQSYGILMEIP